MTNLTIEEPAKSPPLSNIRRALLVLGTLAVAALMFALGFYGPRIYNAIFNPDQGIMPLEYITEAGRGTNQGIVNSPLTVTVTIPWSDGTGNNIIAGIDLSFLDEEGNPAMLGDRPVQTLNMQPTGDVQVWHYVGSVPSRPGIYRAELKLRRLYGTETETLDVKDPGLTVISEPGPPLVSGYVFNRDRNLWMLASDGSRRRRLTFFTSSRELAEHPAWSPDGKSVAFTFQPETAANELPMTSIWSVNADGTGVKPLVEHAEQESLSYPQWSLDGKYLYFTVERFIDNGEVTQPNRYIDRVDIETGVRSPWLPSAVMPAPTGRGDEIVYLEEVAESERASAFTNQRITKAESDESGRSVLVKETDFYDLYAPRMSPDRKWVVFSAVADLIGNQNNDTGFDLMSWLLFKPSVASAHDVPWDLFIVPSEGGTAQRLTTLNDDQLHPVWLDTETIAFMGVKGLQTITIDGSGKAVGEPRRLMDGVRHSTLTWHGP